MLGSIPERKDPNMKTIIKTSIYLLMTTMFLGAAFAGPKATERQVPFHGSLSGVESDAVQFPILFVNGIGTGNATHLGRFTVTYEDQVDLRTRQGTGSIHFIAANGDSVFAAIIGEATPTETPGIVSIVEIGTITGGTGRFAGATGSFILERLVDQATGSTSGSFDGTIVFLKGK